MSTIEQLQLKIQEQERLIETLRAKCCCPPVLRCATHRPHQHQVRLGDHEACRRKTRFDYTGRTTKLVDQAEMANLMNQAKSTDSIEVKGEVLFRNDVPPSTVEETPLDEAQPEETPLDEAQHEETPAFTHDGLKTKKLSELKAMCKEKKLRGYSCFKKKDDLILFMVQTR